MRELFEYLIKNNITVATAESCTGGNIAAELVSFSGISSVFLAGLVTYANSAKERVLGVRESTLEKYGAVSFQCAQEMLVGACAMTGADCAVCTTGIAGPTGGSAEKPVGLVYIGVRYKGKSTVVRYVFSGDRGSVITQAKDKALELLYKTVNKNGGNENG